MYDLCGGDNSELGFIGFGCKIWAIRVGGLALQGVRLSTQNLGPDNVWSCQDVRYGG